MVAKKPGSDEFYMAQEFRKLGIPSFEPGGHWTELDRDGDDRHAKQKKPKKVKLENLNKANLRTWLFAHDVEQDEIDENF